MWRSIYSFFSANFHSNLNYLNPVQHMCICQTKHGVTSFLLHLLSPRYHYSLFIVMAHSNKTWPKTLDIKGFIWNINEQLIKIFILFIISDLTLKHIKVLLLRNRIPLPFHVCMHGHGSSIINFVSISIFEHVCWKCKRG